ncbi:hypothetical protein B0H13DRAFT_1917531 [Mycena leptocephala]|nr:hypothetical protein B0H13DRAFT_1917531 [Mycena leptocephala]
MTTPSGTMFRRRETRSFGSLAPLSPPAYASPGEALLTNPSLSPSPRPRSPHLLGCVLTPWGAQWDLHFHKPKPELDAEGFKEGEEVKEGVKDEDTADAEAYLTLLPYSRCHIRCARIHARIEIRVVRWIHIPSTRLPAVENGVEVEAEVENADTRGLADAGQAYAGDEDEEELAFEGGGGTHTSAGANADRVGGAVRGAWPPLE